MNILYIVDKFPRKGEPKAGKYPLLFRAMHERGNQVLMIAHSAIYRPGDYILDGDELRPGGGFPSAIFKNRRASYYLQKTQFFWKLFRAKRKAETLLNKDSVKTCFNYVASVIERFGPPDVIHVWGEEKSLIGIEIGRAVKQRFDIPLIWNVHGSHGYRIQAVNDEFSARVLEYLKVTDLLLPVSRDLQSHWLRVFGDRININSKVVHNPVDTSIFNVYDLAKHNEITLFHISKMEEVKNIPLLLKAVSIVISNGYKVKLRLAGATGFSARDKSIIQELGLADYIHLVGKLEMEEVAREMNQAHIYVQSSNIETFGNPLAEALCCGIPVVSTSCGGPNDFITEEVGLLSPVGDAQKFAESIVTVINNLDRFQPGSLNSFAVKTFGVDSVCTRLEALYGELVPTSKSEEMIIG